MSDGGGRDEKDLFGSLSASRVRNPGVVAQRQAGAETHKRDFGVCTCRVNVIACANAISMLHVGVIRIFVLSPLS
jgi:hypothetical protein